MARTIAALVLAVGALAWPCAPAPAATSPAALPSLAPMIREVASAVVNVAVVTATIPTKGIPLPLLSYGGSSLMLTLAAIGILIRVSDEAGTDAAPTGRVPARSAAPAAAHAHRE